MKPFAIRRFAPLVALCAVQSAVLPSTVFAMTAPVYDSAAPVAFMIDLSSGKILYDRDSDREIPPASMAKMMTTHVAFRLIKEGKLKLSQKFTVRPETWQKWHGPAAGSTMFLAVNEQVSVENLLHGIVTLSGNDACVVLAEGIAGTEPAFVQMMNEEAKRMGLKHSRFGTSNGWPDNDVTHVTARDLAAIARQTIEQTPDLYRKFYATPSFTWGRTMAGSDITQANRNPILGKIAGADGLKTGHTDEAGYGFTGSAIQNGRRLVMVVAGLPTFNGRIEESVKFMDWGFRAWRSMPLFKQGAEIEKAPVQGGTLRSVALIAPKDLAVTLPTAASDQVKVSVVYDGPIKAPFTKGQEIASLVVRTAGGDTQTMPLIAAEDVAEVGFFGRMWNGLMSLFG
jgi:D-alanyl-D-alanine carboxypeptidase (penicillin-binding protein 5/6)